MNRDKLLADWKAKREEAKRLYCAWASMLTKYDATNEEYKARVKAAGDKVVKAHEIAREARKTYFNSWNRR